MSVAKMRAFPVPVVPRGLRQRRLFHDPPVAVVDASDTETEAERLCRTRTETENLRKRTAETVTVVVFDAPAKTPRLEESFTGLRTNDELRMLYEELLREEAD